MILRRLLFAFLVFAPVVYGQLPTALTVQEALPPSQAGTSRTNEPFSVGIPLKAGDIACGGTNPANCTGISALGLTGSSVGQFRCLVEWSDQSCKWMLIDGQASFSAGGTAGVTVTKTGSGNFGGSNLATDNGTTITVSAGTATFVVKKANFNVLDSVVVGATTLIASGASTGLVVTGPTAGNFSCGALDGSSFIATCTTQYTSSADASSTASIEENGPARAVIVASGRHMNGAQEYMRYVVRLVFYKNENYVRVRIARSNAYPRGSAFNLSYKDFKSYEIRLTPALAGGNKNFNFGTAAGNISGSLSGADNAYSYHAYSSNGQWVGDNEDETYSPATLKYISGTYGSNSYSQNGQVVSHVSNIYTNSASNATTPMWGDFSDSTGAGVLVGHPFGYANWPKAINFSQDAGANPAISVAIWPDQSLWTGSCGSPTPCEKQYIAPWPQVQINEVTLNFHTSALASPVNSFALQQSYLVGRATPAAYNSSGAMDYPLLTAAQADGFFTSNGFACCVVDKTPRNIRMGFNWHEGGATNQSDSVLGNARLFLARGYTGRYLDAMNTARFWEEQAHPRTNGTFTWRSAGSLNGMGQPNDSSSNSFSWNDLSGQNWHWADDEHGHAYGAMLTYYISGDELLKSAIMDGWYDRFLANVGENLGTNEWNERALGIELISLARLYEFANGIGDTANAATLASNIDATFTNAVFPTIPDSFSTTSPRGTNKNRGVHYQGNASCLNGSDPCTAPFQTNILIQGELESASARGSSWANYNLARDYAFGGARWNNSEQQGFAYNPPCSAAINVCQERYYLTMTGSNVGYGDLTQQFGQATSFFQFYVYGNYLGSSASATDNMGTHLLAQFSAMSRGYGSTWWENGFYMVDAALSTQLLTNTKNLVDVTLSCGTTSPYTCTWTAPANVASYYLKHDPARTIVNDIGWQLNNTSTLSTATNANFWSSSYTSQQPTSIVSSIVLSTGLAASGEKFAMKALTDSSLTPPTWVHVGQNAPNHPPVNHGWQGMPYDSGNQCLLTYNGNDSGGAQPIYSNAMWCYKASTQSYVRLWVGATASGSCGGDLSNAPNNRHPYYQWDYDPDDVGTYLDGGSSCGGATGYDMYKLTHNGTANSAVWTKLANVSPNNGARQESTMVYMGNTHKFVSVTGIQDGSYLWNTWEYTPATNTWQLICDWTSSGNANCPQALQRTWAFVDYSSGDGKVLVTGGSAQGGNADTGTWIYDPTRACTPGSGGNCGGTGTGTSRWTKANPAVERPAFAGNACGAYDQTRNRFLLIASTGHLWSYTIAGNTWADLNIAGTNPTPNGISWVSKCGFDVASDAFVFEGFTDASSPPDVWQVGFGGAVVGTPAVSLAPSSLNFVNQLQTTTSVAQNVTLTNTGTATLTISGISISGDFAQSNNCGASLPAAGNCSISVTFTPSVLGAAVGTLTVTDNAAGSPHTVALSGNGTATVFGIGNVTIQGNVTIKP